MRQLLNLHVENPPKMLYAADITKPKKVTDWQSTSLFISPMVKTCLELEMTINIYFDLYLTDNQSHGTLLVQYKLNLYSYNYDDDT